MTKSGTTEAFLEYNDNYKKRDPEGERTCWIFSILLRRPHTSTEIKKLAEGNGLGYKSSTYVTDLTGLVRRNLIYSTKMGYRINEVYGLQFVAAKGIKVS